MLKKQMEVIMENQEKLVIKQATEIEQLQNELDTISDSEFEEMEHLRYVLRDSENTIETLRLAIETINLSMQR